MIDYIALKHVGPASSMNINFAPKLNILTGNNGLGKTFILDIAWFILTRTWPQLPALPHRGKDIQPEIEFRKVWKDGLTKPLKISYHFRSQPMMALLFMSGPTVVYQSGIRQRIIQSVLTRRGLINIFQSKQFTFPLMIFITASAKQTKCFATV